MVWVDPFSVTGIKASAPVLDVLADGA